KGLRDAEVAYHCVSARQEHVRGLDIAVYDALAVSISERVHQVAQNAHRLGHWQLALAGEPLPEGFALHEGDCVVEQVVQRAGGKQRNDVWVLEACGELHLAAEPIGIDPGSELGRQDLDHDAPAELALFGDEDATHPRTPELSLEVVGVTEHAL